jgi:hypothetical protein
VSRDTSSSRDPKQVFVETYCWLLVTSDNYTDDQ